MEKNYNVNLSGVSETMLVPVYARAIESKKKNPVFYDEVAVKIVDTINYDFDKFKRSKMNLWGCAARTILFDREVSKFIKKHPRCTVINMACGLDARFERVDNGTIMWYNIDFESVMNIRGDFIKESERVINLSGSVLDDFWFSKIEQSEEVLVIAEGLLMYFEENDVKKLFKKIAENFENCNIICELMSKKMVNNQEMHDVVRKTTAVFKWGIRDTNDFTKLCPNYRMVGEFNFTDKIN